MSETARFFEIFVPVEAGDIDQNGHVNNVTYLRWAQDAAAAHWRALAPVEDQETLCWVILRHEIDYRQPAYLGDALSVRTWVGSATRFKFERFTEIRRLSDRVLLAKARTVWCALNTETRKPAIVSGDLRALFSVGVTRHGKRRARLKHLSGIVPRTGARFLR
jgi:acyl-CoA thioester hydrolase